MYQIVQTHLATSIANFEILLIDILPKVNKKKIRLNNRNLRVFVRASLRPSETYSALIGISDRSGRLLDHLGYVEQTLLRSRPSAVLMRARASSRVSSFSDLEIKNAQKDTSAISRNAYIGIFLSFSESSTYT